jgi:hypothetical protein
MNKMEITKLFINLSKQTSFDGRIWGIVPKRIQPR